jgi:WD40 repeat protein
MQAHKKQVSALSFSPFIPNMMATSSVDGLIKIWDIAAEGGSKPELIGSRNMQQGDLYSMQFS